VAVEAYYSPPVWTDAEDRDHAFRFTMRGQSVDYTGSIPHTGGDRHFSKPSHVRWLDLSASYRTEFPFHVSGFLSAGYGFGFEASDDRIHGDVGFSRSFGPELNLGVTAGYSGAWYGKDDDDLNLQFRMHYRSRNVRGPVLRPGGTSGARQLRPALGARCWKLVRKRRSVARGG
jgi:hypothetical protein